MRQGTYRALGLMSGTSLDGLDLACVEFSKGKSWKFSVIDATTIPYPDHWQESLRTAHLVSGADLVRLHNEYGVYIGQACSDFVQSRKIKNLDLIASHGHTIFHQPARGFTFQLGEGAAIHAVTGIPVIYDFRSLDVQLGGEGAPLVPVGDQYLFPEADVCLNLGGIANLSLQANGKRKAFDICFCNMALNFLSQERDEAYDKNGRMASIGSVNRQLLSGLDEVYELVRGSRQSLGREIFEASFQPLIADKTISCNDRLRTVCESIAMEIERAIPRAKEKTQVLVTGGGARNLFLTELIRQRVKDFAILEIPPPDIIDFKEAIIFAFLGVLRLRNEVNVLKSVTRARRDSSAGMIVGG